MSALPSREKIYGQLDNIYEVALQNEDMSLALKCLELKLRILNVSKQESTGICVENMDERTLKALIQGLEEKYGFDGN